MKKKTKSLINKKGVKLSRKTGKAPEPTKIPFAKLIYFSILLNSLALVSIIIFQKSFPPQVPLFYGLAEGEDQLTKSQHLIIAPIVSFFILGLNIAVAWFLKAELLKKTLIIAGFFASLFSFITLLQIFLLVGQF